MAAARKTKTDLHKYFKTRRVETEDGAYLECTYKKGTQMIEFQGLNGDSMPGTTSVLINLKINDEDIISKIYYINYAKVGYQIRY
ncbi:hypothetical protein ACJMK2_019729 [Sinanodonta woodiana]|uniref:Uncharacterized protein n=1 Tax=Sinanodonta woodiana TaxID=1069815 RepID=A0ABD3TWS5_SINWO